MFNPQPSATRLLDAAGVGDFFAALAQKIGFDRSRPVFLCIGTDRSTGDSLGPWVGTLLARNGFPRVIGTIEQPCDADQLPGVLETLEATHDPVVAIDACLGRPEHIGRYLAAEGPLQPARSVGRVFPPVGAYSVAAIVGPTGPKPYWTLQTISLHRVLLMAQAIADAATAPWASGAAEAHLNSWRTIRYNTNSE